MSETVHAAINVPAYRALPTVKDTGEHCTWGIFGPDDQLGTIHFITGDRVVAAAATITTGEMVNLTLPLDQPSPPLASGREQYQHSVLATRMGRDDRLDNFFPQGSTQWDGLGHIRFREFGYYNGRTEEDLDAGQLGIDALARHGLMTRGVLVDYARWCEEVLGRKTDPRSRVPVTPADLDRVLAWEGEEVRPGDCLLLRTGWLEWYLSLDEANRTKLAGTLHNGDGGVETPGLDPAPATAEWLWDRRVSAVAADNPALEALRVRRDEGFLHRRLIALLGMPIGEFWALGELSAVCQRLGRYAFFLSATPFPLPQGVGSPANAVAVF